MSRRVLLRDQMGAASPVFGFATLPFDMVAEPAVLIWRGTYFVPGGIQEGEETYRKAAHLVLADDAVTI